MVVVCSCFRRRSEFVGLYAQRMRKESLFGGFGDDKAVLLRKFQTSTSSAKRSPAIAALMVVPAVPFAGIGEAVARGGLS